MYLFVQMSAEMWEVNTNIIIIIITIISIVSIVIVNYRYVCAVSFSV